MRPQDRTPESNDEFAYNYYKQAALYITRAMKSEEPNRHRKTAMSFGRMAANHARAAIRTTEREAAA